MTTRVAAFNTRCNLSVTVLGASTYGRPSVVRPAEAYISAWRGVEADLSIIIVELFY